MQTVLVTGAAGFIGSRVAEMLLEQGQRVIGVDNLNEYYDVRLKLWRRSVLEKYYRFSFFHADIEDFASMRTIFRDYRPEAVINEAARAGVRYSLENPFVYLSTNAGGTLNLLELCRQCGTAKFILASTSSLYAGLEMPFREELPVNTPISPYAASKKAAEALAYTYHHLYGIDVSVLRYFTVYGPAGRPDMGVFRFIRWIQEDIPLRIYGDGTQSRDFTYVDDIARGTIMALKPVGYEVINLGNNSPSKLMELIRLIELFTGRRAEVQNYPPHIADMKDTWADVSRAEAILGWKPEVSLEGGVEKTVDWSMKNWEWLKNIEI
ncbi:NAD-dependent epimerase/dehydratase family protein [Pelotomaculum propionicicum]|uniref:NAD-dependent epimerase/dehydratase family protein n=1 Tax=Pelotomaculum propionicicum TaxID=258475 RepID=UPI003B766D8B